jgi:hypothetical protein
LRRAPFFSSLVDVKAPKLILLALIAITGLSWLGCAARGGRLQDGPETGPTFGLYRARLTDAEGQVEKFRLLLFAASPDRLHGEVLSPTGNTVLIFDGGQGRIAVTFVRDRVAYVGPAGAEALDKLVGVPLTLDEMVRGLLEGARGGEPYSIVREPDEAGLPQSIEIRAEGRSLGLQLKRLRPLQAPPEGLGTGNPPEGMELLPLDRLEPIRHTEPPAGEGT